MTTDKKELELLDGFRQLCPADKNTVMSLVSVAVSAENAIRLELGAMPKTPACAARGRKHGEAV